MRKRNLKFLKVLLITVFLITATVFSSVIIASRLRTTITAGYILTSETDANGNVSEQVKYNSGVLGIFGKLFDFLFGGDFTSDKLAKSVSANIYYDIETPTVIDSKPAPTSSASAENTPDTRTSIVERNINSGGGKTKVSSLVTVNNETSYTIDASSLNSDTPAFSANSPVQVLIYHSHATESYQPDDKFDFTHSSSDRSIDTRYNMIAVGEKLAAELNKNGITTVHLKGLYDYPEYNNAYAKSCTDIEKTLTDNPSIKIALDLHRDAITTQEGQKVKLTADIDGRKAAQVMLVVGTDELGLKHDNWRTNLKFAADLQKEFLAVNPDFARPINLRTSRFNGHVASGAVIIEVGTAGNTLSEALVSAEYISKAVVSLADKYKQ